MVDKLIVTSRDDLGSKYGPNVTDIENAVATRVTEDAAHGLVTRLAYLDDFGAQPNDQQSVKQAVDGAFKEFQPAYLMLLGAQDVVPQQDLVNPVYAPNVDDDQFVPSDLPYACDAPYSDQIADFVGPSRVVARLPDLVGATDPAYLVHLLSVTTVPQPRDAYLDYFGLSAMVWDASTRLSATTAFGVDSGVQTSPPDGAPWAGSVLGRLSHFINCHGAQVDPNFYGQQGNNYPVAISTSDLEPTVTYGTTAAAECCYGAALFDPQLAGALPIGNAYLARGAAGYVGSTTIAYGPASGNGQADLMCLFWFNSVLAGASIGRAMLEARQNYIAGASPLDPTDLKTLGQFLVMGDPSATPVQGSDSKGLPRSSQREAVAVRRADSSARAAALLDTTAVARTTVTRDLPDVPFDLPRGVHLAFAVEPPRAQIQKGARSATTELFVHVYFGAEETPIPGLRATRGILVTESAGQVVSRREFVSR